MLTLIVKDAAGEKIQEFEAGAADQDPRIELAVLRAIAWNALRVMKARHALVETPMVSDRPEQFEQQLDEVLDRLSPHVAPEDKLTQEDVRAAIE